MRALGALLLGDLERALDRAAMAGDDDLRGIVVVGDDADLALRGGVGDGPGDLDARRRARRPSPPRPTGTARCIAWPRSLSSRAVVGKSKEPAAQSALYSPRLWPATKSALSIEMPDTRKVATALAMIAGWAFSVRVSSSCGPFGHQPEQLLAAAPRPPPRTGARATLLASASALPMPTDWLPCPGKMNARIDVSLRPGLVGRPGAGRKRVPGTAPRASHIRCGDAVATDKFPRIPSDNIPATSKIPPDS